MFGGRYPHAEAGRAVAPLFGVGGAIGGVVAALVIPNAPPPVINAVLWAGVGAITAFLVYSSEGPRARPASLVQAAVADGIVTGMIATISCSLLDLVVAAGAGSSTGRPVTAGLFLQTVLLGAGAGLLGGTVLGFATVPVAGRERLERERRVKTVKRRSRKRKAKR